LEALDPFQCKPHQGVLDVATWLEGASIWVDVNVTHRSLDANAAVWGPPGVGMQDVHKLGIASGQSALVVCVLKSGTSRIQTWLQNQKEELFLNHCCQTEERLHG